MVTYSVFIILCFIFAYFIVLLCRLFFIRFSTQPRFSLVNVVLVINDSLIFAAPSAPIWLSVHFLLFFYFCFSFLFYISFHCSIYYFILYSGLFFIILSSPYRFSSVNVVLVINDSLIFAAPSAPISSSVHDSSHSLFLFFKCHTIFHRSNPVMSMELRVIPSPYV